MAGIAVETLVWSMKETNNEAGNTEAVIFAFTPYDRSVFYTPRLSRGYIHYPFSRDFLVHV